MVAVVHQALLMVQMPVLEWPLNFDLVDPTPLGDTLLTTQFASSHGVTFPSYPLWGDGPTPTGSIIAAPGTTAPGPLLSIYVDRTRGYRILQIRVFFGGFPAAPTISVRDTVRAVGHTTLTTATVSAPIWSPTLLTLDITTLTGDTAARIDQIDIGNASSFYSLGDFTLVT